MLTNPVLDAPIFGADCVTRLAGDAYRVQAYIGFTPDSLSPLGRVDSFRTGDRAGYFVPYILEIPGTDQGTLVYLQLRAWEASAGSSYEIALAAGKLHGYSNIVPIRTDMPPGTPDTPVGLQSFCLVLEPSAGALLALGGTLWLVSRRAVGRL